MDIEKEGALLGEHRIEAGSQVACKGDGRAGAADRVGDHRMVDPGERADFRRLPEAQDLGMALEAEDRIVEHDQLDVDAVPDGAFQLRPAMRETAIADHRDDGGGGQGEARAERQRVAPADSGESARKQEVPAGLACLQILRDPETGIAGIGDEDRVPGRPILQHMHQVLRPQWVAGVQRQRCDLVRG